MSGRRSVFPYWLGLIFVGFIGILVYVYIESEKANPVLLDEKGNVRGSAKDSSAR